MSDQGQMDPRDAAFLAVFGGASFGGSVTLPSGRTYSGAEITALSAVYAQDPPTDGAPRPVRSDRPEPAPLTRPKPEVDWGVAWFGGGTQEGTCRRCRQSGRVHQGYNGGAHMGTYCARCMGPVLRGER